MKLLNDFKITERPALKVLPIQFGGDEVNRCIVVHHVKRVIRQHPEELQKLADQ